MLNLHGSGRREWEDTWPFWHSPKTGWLCAESGEGGGGTGLQSICLCFHLIFNHLKWVCFGFLGGFFVICWFFVAVEAGWEARSHYLLCSSKAFRMPKHTSLQTCKPAYSCPLPYENSLLYNRVPFPGRLFPLPKLAQAELIWLQTPQHWCTAGVSSAGVVPLHGPLGSRCVNKCQ